MNQWIVIGGVAVILLLVACEAKARADQASPAYAYNPQNWRTLPGYIAAQGGGVVM
ncbi:MAG: hypothetical protein ACYCVW_17015 [Rhodocyclaceae bacterium]